MSFSPIGANPPELTVVTSYDWATGALPFVLSAPPLASTYPASATALDSLVNVAGLAITNIPLIGPPFTGSYEFEGGGGGGSTRPTAGFLYPRRQD